MGKFEHQEQGGKVILSPRKDEKDLIIEDLTARLATLEAREKQRDPSFKVPAPPDGFARK